MLEVGIAGDVKLAAFRKNLHIEFTGDFTGKCEVSEVNPALRTGASGVPEPLRTKSARPSTEQTIYMNLPDVGEVEIVTHQIEAIRRGKNTDTRHFQSRSNRRERDGCYRKRIRRERHESWNQIAERFHRRRWRW